MELIQPFYHTIVALGTLAVLMLIQVLIADAIGITRKHTPGAPVPADHSDLLFRAGRVVANTNETVVIFVLATLFCILSQASPQYTAYAAWLYVGARILYALCYYLNLQLLRSLIFAIALLAVAGLSLVGFVT